MDNDKDKQEKPGLMSKGINAANRTQSTLKWATRAKKVYQIASTAGEAIGTAPAWIVPVTVGVVCLIVLVVIFGVITPGATVGGNLVSPSPGASVSPGPSASTTPFSGKVSDYFSIVGGSSALQGNINSILATPLAYPLYASNLNDKAYGKTTITLYPNTATGYNDGWMVTDQYGNNISIYGNAISSPYSYLKYLLIHETGHVVGHRNLSLENSFYSTAKKDGSACYSSAGYLKTFPPGLYRSWDSTAPEDESFAESVADYVLCGTNQACDPNGGGSNMTIQSFPTTCPNTYNFLKAYVFGN